MSYNISRSKYLSGKLSIHLGKAKELYEKYKTELPENCFLDHVINDITRYNLQLDTYYEIEKFQWSGDFSGFYFNKLVEILKETIWSADILLIWEGGDSFDGIRVTNGSIARMKIEIKLVK